MTNGRITGYEVRYREVGEAQDKVVLVAETFTELMGLKPNTTYNISVLAINGAGNGEVTDIQGTTLVNSNGTTLVNSKLSKMFSYIRCLEICMPLSRVCRLCHLQHLVHLCKHLNNIQSLDVQKYYNKHFTIT